MYIRKDALSARTAALQDADNMNIESGYISLRGLRFHACHGVLPQERITGNDYILDVCVKYDVSNAVLTDNVEDTLDYARIYGIVKKEMGAPSCLLEHVAGRIGRKIFDTFPLTEEATISVMKINPPIGADCDGAEIKLHLINDKTL